MAERGPTRGGLYLGIEIGGTKLQIFAGDSEAKIIDRRRFDVKKSKGAAGIRRQLQKSIPSILEQFQPRAIGVGFGGPVDWKTGAILCSHQIQGWDSFPMGTWLADLSKARVVVENDANVAALGEAMRGAGRGFETVFYVTLGSGVGGGLVQSGKIYHGLPPGEVEIGHLRLDKCGATVEDRCSGWAVNKRIRAAAAKNPKGILAQLIKNQRGQETRILLKAVKALDRQAIQILRETADDLAFGLSHVTHLFHPDVIVLGGGLSLLGEPWRELIAHRLPRYLMRAFGRGPKIVLSGLKEDAVPVGALHLASRA